LRSHPEFAFVVGRGESAQFIAGYANGRCILLTFDQKGNLQAARSKKVPALRKRFLNQAYDTEGVLEVVQQELGVEDYLLTFGQDCVHVKRFFVDDFRVGIVDARNWRKLDTEIIEYLKQSGAYEFFWDGKYDIEAGEVVST
jgi:hypothetical protein